jgi:hypothetical protein
MAKSELKCPNGHCAMTGKWTNLSVCRKCRRATVHAIYQPKPSNVYRRRRARSPLSEISQGFASSCVGGSRAASRRACWCSSRWGAPRGRADVARRGDAEPRPLLVMTAYLVVPAINRALPAERSFRGGRQTDSARRVDERSKCPTGARRGWSLNGVEWSDEDAFRQKCRNGQLHRRVGDGGSSSQDVCARILREVWR